MSRMSGSVRSRYFIDRIRFGVEKPYFCFFGFWEGVKSIPPGDSLFRLRTPLKGGVFFQQWILRLGPNRLGKLVRVLWS